MRIIAGRYRGKLLVSVGTGDAAAHLRPTTDRVRENIFNMLQGGRYGNPISGARVLDLFAGTGALGLEALSRGASHVCFVDNGAKAGALIRENIKLLDATPETTYQRGSALKLGPCPFDPFDLIFLDPPYDKGMGDTALVSAIAGNWIADDALIVMEDGSAMLPPPGMRQLDQRRYGNTHIMILRQEETE